MPPPFRADQVGSLLRPRDLVAARAAIKADPFDSAAQSRLESLQSSSIAGVVEQQITHGVRPITSGEFERELFYSGFFERLGGFTLDPAGISLESKAWRRHFPTLEKLREQGFERRSAPVCVGRVSYEGGCYVDDWLYLKSLVPPDLVSQCKMTLPSVTFMHMNFADGQAYTADSPYTNDREFLMDLAAAFRQEVLALYNAGCRCIQVDDPNLSYFCNEGFVRKTEQENYDLAALLQLYIDVHNECVRDFPPDLYFGLHICRGNAPNSTWYSTGGYEPIAEKVFTQMRYDTFYLEFDDPARSGGFAPLRHLPTDRSVVLGLVTTKSPEMERLEELKERVLAAADVIAEGQGGGRTREEVLRDNLAVSPQCGFSSASYGGGQGVTEEVMWKKLELVRDLAKEVWPE